LAIIGSKSRTLEAESSKIEKNLCLLLMPFSEPWSDDVHKLLKRAINKCGMRCERADEKDGEVIIDDILEAICRARVIIADLTSNNLNVIYEIGQAHARSKKVILLSQTPKDIPFDLLHLRLIIYENTIGGGMKLSEEIESQLRKAMLDECSNPE